MVLRHPMMIVVLAIGVIGVNEGQSRVNDDPGTEFMAILTETVSRACTL